MFWGLYNPTIIQKVNLFWARVLSLYISLRKSAGVYCLPGAHDNRFPAWFVVHCTVFNRTAWTLKPKRHTFHTSSYILLHTVLAT